MTLAQRALKAANEVRDIVKAGDNWERYDLSRQFEIRAVLQRTIRELQQVHDGIFVIPE